MAFCGKCGTQVETGVRFCPSCGATIASGSSQAAQADTAQAVHTIVHTSVQDNISAGIQGLNNTADTTAEYAQEDITQNKAMGILAYFGPLVLLPIFAAPGSKFARFHANQGLLVLIGEIAYGIVQAILMAILRAVFPWNWSYGYLGGRGAIFGILSTVLSLVWIVFTVLAIIGILNAVQGKAKELPLIGKFRILK